MSPISGRLVTMDVHVEFLWFRSISKAFDCSEILFLSDFIAVAKSRKNTNEQLTDWLLTSLPTHPPINPEWTDRKQSLMDCWHPYSPISPKLNGHIESYQWEIADIPSPSPIPNRQPWMVQIEAITDWLLTSPFPPQSPTSALNGQIECYHWLIADIPLSPPSPTISTEYCE